MKSNILIVFPMLSVVLSAYSPHIYQDSITEHVGSRRSANTDAPGQLIPGRSNDKSIPGRQTSGELLQNLELPNSSPSQSKFNLGTATATANNRLIAGQASNQQVKILGPAPNLSPTATKLLNEVQKIAIGSGSNNPPPEEPEPRGPIWNPLGEPTPGGGFMFRFDIPGPGDINAPSSGSLGPEFTNYEQGLFDYITEHLPVGTNPGSSEALAWLGDQVAAGVFNMQQFGRVFAVLADFWSDK